MDNNHRDDAIGLIEETSDGIVNREMNDGVNSDSQNESFHHSHHSHYSHHRRKKHRHRTKFFSKKNKERIGHFLAKNKRYFIHATITLVAIVCLIVAGFVIDEVYSSQKKKSVGFGKPNHTKYGEQYQD